jgi:predicted O-methyltransferase YrrM
VPESFVDANVTYDDLAIGPIGQADRGVLVAVARYYHRPAVLEYGSAYGHSAQAWLDGAAATVHCVDISYCDELHAVIAASRGRAKYFRCDQAAFAPSARYDIIFIDASHDLEANIATLNAAHPALLPGGCVVIHDTGKWAAGAMTPAHRAFAGDCAEDGGKWHQPGEVRFVEWMRAEGWQCVSLASASALRHGLTLCQPGGGV